MAEIQVVEGFELDGRRWAVSDGNVTPTVRELIAGAERHDVPRLRLRVASWKTAAGCRELTDEQKETYTERDLRSLAMDEQKIRDAEEAEQFSRR